MDGNARVIGQGPGLGEVGGVAGLHLGNPPLSGAERTDLVIGETFGIVRDCRELPPLPELPHVHIRVALGPRGMPGWPLSMPVEGTGVSTEPDVARRMAVSEALERYCAVAPVGDELLVRGSYRRLQPHAVPPDSFALLSRQQYRRFPRLRPLTPDKVIDWRRAYSLSREREVLVPAALVHLTRVGRPPNDYIPELGSTGLACHTSIARAILAGLCEALERDALTIAWHTRLPLTAVDPEETVAGRLVGEAGLGAPAFSLFQVPTDSPFPVVMALACHDSRYPHAVVGSACRPDPAEAAVKALCETVQMCRRLRSRPAAKPKRIRQFDHHAELYATVEGCALLRRNLVIETRRKGLGSLPAVATGDPTVDVKQAVSALAALGLEVLVCDLTTPDVADAGFRAVRVLVPGLMDMSMDGRFSRLGSSRLFELPVALGLQPSVSRSQLNLMPVPLA